MSLKNKGSDNYNMVDHRRLSGKFGAMRDWYYDIV